MSQLGPFGEGGPFEDLMRNLARLFSEQGPVNWEIARQLAPWTASGGQPDTNPDPVARVRLEELFRVAELHVADATGLPLTAGAVLRPAVVNRSEWALRTLAAWRPLFERLAGAMASAAGGLQPDEPSPPDPMAQLLGNIPQVVGPLLFGIQAGTMVGELGARAMGQYDLPMPRPPGDELLLVPATIDRFASDWSLAADDARLWVCVREITSHAVLGRPHVRQRLDRLIGEYVGAFRPDPGALEARMADFDPSNPASLQGLLGDPEALLGELQNDDQRRLARPLRSLLSTVAGYTDHIMDRVGRPLIGAYGPLNEALRRRRLEEEAGTRMLGQLFGVALDAEAYERGQAFVAGVVERAGEDSLAGLWRSEKELPTPAELEAPGLWLARIELPEEE